MFGKKIESKSLLNDDNVKPEVLELLNNHRVSVELLQKISTGYIKCETDSDRDKLLEKQTKVYEEINMQEVCIRKFGYNLVIESHPPYAWALNDTDYKKYMATKK
ncbi:MAG: hypothetical protein Ta2F_10430 [Termitinemataceae bacterium]|nr:MAG: hypothetical protein Ta2F_10430 [Termitinemataceae bacterium]